MQTSVRESRKFLQPLFAGDGFKAGIFGMRVRPTLMKKGLKQAKHRPILDLPGQNDFPDKEGICVGCSGEGALAAS